AVWLGIAGWWLTQDAPEAPPPEELDAIPVELLDEPAPLAEEPRDGLPEEDPVEIIEELVEIPRAQAPQPATSTEARPELEEAARRARAEAAAERQRAEEEARQRADAEVERKRPEEEARRRAALERSNAGDAGVAAKDAGARSRPVAKPAPQRRAIDNPVALVGKAGDVAKSNANLQLILYADRIREHPVGRRIGKLLPRLPQWNDFFGDGQLNP